MSAQPGEFVLKTLRSDKHLGRASVLSGEHATYSARNFDISAEASTQATTAENFVGSRKTQGERVPVEFLHNGKCSDALLSKLRVCYQRTDLLNDTRRALEVVVCYSTTEYRHLARTIPREGEYVLEIGCSTGKASAILSRNSGKLTAVDISTDCIAQCNSDMAAGTGAQPDNTTYHCFDVFADRASLLNILSDKPVSAIVSDPVAKVDTFTAKGDDTTPSVIFFDIGGNRDVHSVVELLAFLRRYMEDTCALVVIKSEALCGEMYSQLGIGVKVPKDTSDFHSEVSTDKNDRMTEHTRDTADVVRDPKADEKHMERKAGGGQIQMKANGMPEMVPCPTHPSIGLSVGSTRIPVCVGWWRELETRERLNAIALSYDESNCSPFAANLYHQRRTPNQTYSTGNATSESPYICRFHNYSKSGCKQYRSTKQPTSCEEECAYDHDHCHACLMPGHIARKCPLAEKLGQWPIISDEV